MNQVVRFSSSNLNEQKGSQSNVKRNYHEQFQLPIASL